MIDLDVDKFLLSNMYVKADTADKMSIILLSHKLQCQKDLLYMLLVNNCTRYLTDSQKFVFLKYVLGCILMPVILKHPQRECMYAM